LSIIERGEIYRKKHPEKTIEDFPPGKMHIKEIRDIFNEDNIPTRAISLMWNQRSVDTFLGLPFNIASYATLLIMLGKEVNMMPDYLIGSLGDVHLYKNHIEQAKELITRTPYKLPKLEITNCNIQNGEFDYELIGYQSHPTIKAPLSN
jgi:thymidylate synthase